MNDHNETGGDAGPRARISRRTFLAGTAATAAALALPANRKLMNFSATKNASDDQLTIALYDTAAATAKAVPYVSQFTKQYGIKVNLIGIPANSWVGLFQAVSTRLAGGQTLDSAYIATEGMLLFEQRGTLDPLDPYIAKEKSLLDSYYSDLNPHMLSDFRTLDDLKGHTYFLPIGYNVMSMWINLPVFSALGVKVPSPDWTWGEFEAAAAKIASPPNRYGFAIGTPVPGPFTDVYPWVLTAGGQIMNATQTACVADNPAAVEAASFVRGLVTKKLVNEPGGSYNSAVEAAGQKLGMFGGGIWPNADFSIPQSAVNKQFTIVPWPKLRQAGTPIGVGGFPMFSSSKAKPALWEFIKWSISPEFQAGPLVPFAGDMPIRRSVATSSSFLKKFPPGTDYFVSELSYSTMIIGVPNAGAVENEISTAWEQILSGSTSPADGMKTMQDTCNQLMKQKV
jgi:multiple sugar transport system substrate-binding protein